MALITISAGTVGDSYQGTETEPVLRVLVSDTFTAASSEMILRTVRDEGEFYAEHTCFVVGGEINFPQFQIHSTEDALANPDNAAYTFALYDSLGNFIQVIAKRIRVPATPTTTSLPALQAYSSVPSAPPPVGDPSTHVTQAQLNAAVDAVTLILASEAEAIAGTNNAKYMTPLRVAEEIDARVPALTFATQAEAEAGTNNSKSMTPLRVAEEIAALVPVFSFATQAEAEAGTNNSKGMTPLRTFESIAVHILDTVYGAGWNGDTTHTASRNAIYDKIEAVIAYCDSLVVGLIDDRGTHDASGNTFPTTGGSGPAGAIKKGDLWSISVAGTLGGIAVKVGDWIRALVDTPGSTVGNWAFIEGDFGYTPENQANKSSSISGDTGSTTKYPTVAAVEAHTATKVSDTAYDATSWNGVTDVAPSKNAVRDKIESMGTGLVSDTAYGAGWNGDTTTAPSKNAVYDKIETLSVGGGGAGAGILSARRTGATAYDDEFEASTLNAKWTQSGSAPTLVSYDDIVRSAVYLRTSGAQDYNIKQSFVPGSSDFALTVCGMMGLYENFNNFALQVEDSTANNWLQIAWVFGTTKKITYAKQVSGSPTFDINVFTVPSQANDTITPDQVLLHIQRVGSTWSLWTSYNGNNWQPLTTSHTQTITVDKIMVNLGTGGGSSVKLSGCLHWIRKDWQYLSV